MTAASPLIIDVGDMKVECVVGEKSGTATLATQTEQVGHVTGPSSYMTSRSTVYRAPVR